MTTSHKKKDLLPKNNFTIIIASIFIIELFTMFLLHSTNFPLIIGSIIDSMILIVLAAPFLYLYLYRPLKTLIEEANLDKEMIQRYAHIISVANEHMSFLDSHYSYRAVNDSYLRAHNKRRDEIIGHSVIELLGEDLFNTFIKEKLDRALAGEEVRYESWFDFPGAGRKYMDVSYHPCIEENNLVTGIVVDSRDITEYKETQMALEEARKNAEAANTAKSEFLASVSHEIRTPMQVILGMSEMLRDSELSHEQEKSLNTMVKACNILIHLINDVLDLAKIEAGHFELDETEFELETEMAETKSILGAMAKGKGLQLSAHIEPDVPTRLVGDAKSLLQILFNLVNNAVKFTREGRVDINVRKTEGREDIVELEFSVKDTGIGIPHDKLDLIFERFTQADSSTTRIFGGTGLGTTISKKLVDMMGGKIWVESKEGEGSTFFFTVRMKIAEGPAEEAIKKRKKNIKRFSDQLPLNILIVEDSEENIMVLNLYFKKTPHIIETAENGKIGLEKFQSGDYDLVLMDMEMPVMDGYKASREIRRWENENKKKPTPIVALTAHALSEHKQKSIDAGCTAHITKPIKKEEFLEVINEYEQKKR